MRIGLFGNHAGLARQISETGVEVVVHDGRVDDVRAPALPGSSLAEQLVELFTDLDEPRLFVLDLPVGPAIDRLIDAAYVIMEPGDVVIDTSASYWCDTLRRFARMRHRSL